MANLATAKAIVLLFFVAAGNSLRLDALRGLMEELVETEAMEKKEVTLQEHLDSLEMPDPLSRDARSNPNVLCDKCPTPSFPSNDTKCQSGRWKPDYVKQDDGCDCLSTYKCCNDQCQSVDVKSCWENGQKGSKYGILEKDCCDCPVVKCIGCESVIPEEQSCPRGEGAKPTDCYNYTKHFSHATDANACWLSHCTVKSSDAFNSTCLPACQSNKMVTTHCQFPQNDCQNHQVLADCPNKDKEKATNELKKPKICYHPAVESDDDPSGFYYDDDKNSCEKCKKWTYTEKSCTNKNEEAKNEDCHEYGEHMLNKKCFNKDITKDDCGCDLAQCELVDQGDPEVFEPEDACPKNHVKIAGVSLCMKRRDACKKCAQITPIDPKDCKNGKIVTEKDSVGCDVSRCEKAEIPLDGCPCKNFLFDTNSKTLKCNCAILEGLIDGFQIIDGWILMQQHDFTDGNAFLNKKWLDYKYGFYGGASEFWLGLHKMHQFTRDGTWHLKVELTYDLLHDWNPSPRQGQKGVGEWDYFSIGPESGNYKLKIGKMFKNDNMGTADPMQGSNNAPFSSSDRDHDTWGDNCAARGGGGWWFYSCYSCCGNCLRSATRSRNWFIWCNGLECEQVSEMKMWIKRVD